MIIFPFYNMLIMSLGRYEDVVGNAFYIWPRGITFDNYERVFADDKFIRSMGISAFNVVFGTILNLIMTCFAAYGLSRKNLVFRKQLFYIILITMYFSGGLIPWYLVIRSLGLIDTIFAMTIPSMISTFNFILVRNFFLSIPESIEESARLDGAGEMTIMMRIYVPLSLPIFATIGLFCAVAFWNDWWLATLFIQNQKLLPLAQILRKTVLEGSLTLAEGAAYFRGQLKPTFPRSLQAAAVIVSMVPIMIIYPFLQRYFTKGIMLGAIKA